MIFSRHPISAIGTSSGSPAKEHRTCPNGRARCKLRGIVQQFAWHIGAFLFVLAAGATAQAYETKAKQAFLVDAASGTILFSKNPDEKIPPASLAKLMTMETVFHELGRGKVTLDQQFPVSEHAWRTGGAPSGSSTMFAKLKSTIRLEDLVRGVIIQSANDGAIVIAEGMAGSEEKFAERMNERATELGLKNSTFKNPTGLPANGQVSTVRDLVRLGEHIWRTYPQFYRIYSEREFAWNGITQRNRNPLLGADIGADGMKTGFTEESGYAIVGSVARGDTRLFLAMSGLTSEKERADEALKLLRWGLDGFKREPVFPAGQTIGAVKLYGGTKTSLLVRAAGPVSVPIPNDSTDRLTARIVYHGPVMAPVEEGAPVGSLKVTVGDMISQETPLYAAESVGVGSLQQRAWDATKELAVGWLR